MLGIDHVLLRLLLLPATHEESFKSIFNMLSYIPLAIVCIYILIRFIFSRIKRPQSILSTTSKSKILWQSFINKITTYIHIDTIK